MKPTRIRKRIRMSVSPKARERQERNRLRATAKKYGYKLVNIHEPNA